MNKKYIVVGGKTELSNSDILSIEQNKIATVDGVYAEKRKKAQAKIEKEIEIIAPKDRVIVKIDLQSKNSHTFADGTTIRLERQYNNLNRRETEPVNAIVVAAKNIPKGATILVHHNANHDVNKIFDFNKLEGDDLVSDVQYYSVPEGQCYLWKIDGGEWQPCTGFATGLRVFKPYTGILEGIKPTQIKDVLYIKSGEFKGKVVHTLRSCDYEIIFQGDNGQENRVIRCRHFEDNEEHDREEIIAIHHDLTEKVKSGEYFVGLSNEDCKKLNPK